MTIFSTDELVPLFSKWTALNDLNEGDAEELLFRDDLTKHQRKWLSAFVMLWDATAQAEDEARRK